MAAENSAETTSGMPQLDFNTFPNQIFWIVVFTVLFYLVVRYLIVPRLENIMSSRQDLINADIQQAEEFNEEAREIEKTIAVMMEKAQQEVLSISKSTKTQLKEKADSVMKEIDETVAKQTVESEKRINEIQKKSKKDIRKIAVDLSVDLIGKFDDKKLSTKDIEDLIDAEIERTVK